MSLFRIYEGNYLLVYWLAHYSSYCIPIVFKVCKINYIDPMSRIKCWVSFQEETKLRLTELIVYFIGGIVCLCQDDKLGVCVQQPSKCHIKCVKTDSRGCKPGTIKRDFTPIWFVPACGMSAKLSPLIELTPGEWENGINGHNGHYASEQTWLSGVCVTVSVTWWWRCPGRRVWWWRRGWAGRRTWPAGPPRTGRPPHSPAARDYI